MEKLRQERQKLQAELIAKSREKKTKQDDTLKPGTKSASTQNTGTPSKRDEKKDEKADEKKDEKKDEGEDGMLAVMLAMCYG